jgi:hypothetical protein
MLVRLGMCAVVLMLVGLVPSCAKMPEWETPGQGAVEEFKDTTAIPSQWGKLVAVTNAPAFQYEFQLWLQDEEGRVRLVNYDLRKNRLMPTVRVINRR